MPGSLDDLSFTVWPPAIDISTPANPQSFAPQFGVANTSATETISLTRALLLVPVTTTGTNLAQNTDMKSNAITSGWGFKPTSTPPSDPGYVAFALHPDDDQGAIAPGGSVAFILTGVKVNTVAGSAVLRLEAKTSAGLWTPTRTIELTTPDTKPTITNHGITPADPQTLTTLQGQAVVLSWTTTGAAYCVIEDDQGNKWENLPTSGTLSDTPLQGNSETQSTAKFGRYYNRTYHFYAYPAGATLPADVQDSVIIQLPTISFTVSPGSITPKQSVTETWSVANIDPKRGAITLTLAPTDGTGIYTIAIAPNHTSGSGVVTPTPQTTTTYTLSVDNGYGATFSSPQQPVTSSLQPGWQELHGLETLKSGDPLAPSGLVAFADQLWCWMSNPPGLFRTVDGTGWTAVTPSPALPPLDGLIVADLGDGEKLWAFGGAPFLASSSDGIHWDTMATPTYPKRTFGNYVAGDGTILVIGGRDMGDAWSTSDGRTWTQVGNNFPGVAVARFAGKLQAVGDELMILPGTNIASSVFTGYSSSDGGKTWSPTTVPPQVSAGLSRSLLLPVGGVLLFLGLVNIKDACDIPVAMVMDPAGAWSAADLLPPHLFRQALNWSAATYLGCLWVGCLPLGDGDPTQENLQFFRLNRVMPETPFTLTPTGNSSSK